MRRALAAVAAAVLLSSCIPNTPTAPPDAKVPSSYSGLAAPGAPSLADLPWRKLYADPVLQDLIARALAKNYNVLEAYQAVLAAQANLTIVHANQLPAAQANVQAPYENVQGSRGATTPTNSLQPQGSIAASYQVDLFGELASSTAAARATLLATQEAQNVVYVSLVNQVATAYFQLLELDTTLDITLKTVKAREENVHLMALRVQYGESSLQDLLQAKQLLYEASENLPLVHQSIDQTQNALSVLVGDYPHDIVRGLPLDQQVAMPLLPPTGIPSQILTQRPDIKQAEFQLAAADAQIDVARKLLLPSFTFGGSATVEGTYVDGLGNGLPAFLTKGINGVFAGPTGLFALLPSLTQPIFNGGKLRANVRLAQAQQQQLTFAYLLAVENAFTDVSNAVVAYNQQRLYRGQTKLYVDASSESQKLAILRYTEGQTSYLEVVNAETQYYTAAIGDAQAQLSERLALVNLYTALGGGWQ